MQILITLVHLVVWCSADWAKDAYEAAGAERMMPKQLLDLTLLPSVPFWDGIALPDCWFVYFNCLFVYCACICCSGRCITVSARCSCRWKGHCFPVAWWGFFNSPQHHVCFSSFLLQKLLVQMCVYVYTCTHWQRQIWHWVLLVLWQESWVCHEVSPVDAWSNSSDLKSCLPRQNCCGFNHSMELLKERKKWYTQHSLAHGSPLRAFHKEFNAHAKLAQTTNTC